MNTLHMRRTFASAILVLVLGCAMLPGAAWGQLSYGPLSVDRENNVNGSVTNTAETPLLSVSVTVTATSPTDRTVIWSQTVTIGSLSPGESRQFAAKYGNVQRNALFSVTGNWQVATTETPEENADAKKDEDQGDGNATASQESPESVDRTGEGYTITGEQTMTTPPLDFPKGAFLFSFTSPPSAEFTLYLKDAEGNVLKTLFSKQKGTGSAVFELDAGSYVLLVEAPANWSLKVDKAAAAAAPEPKLKTNISMEKDKDGVLVFK